MWWLTHLVSSWWWDNSLECMSSVHPAEPGWLSLDSHLLSLLCAISSTSCAFFWFCLVQLFLCVCSLAISKACTVHLWGHTVYCLWRTYSKACEHRGGPIGQMGGWSEASPWLLSRLPSRVFKVVNSFWIPSVCFNPWLLWSSSPYPWVMQITLVFWGVRSSQKDIGLFWSILYCWGRCPSLPSHFPHGRGDLSWHSYLSGVMLPSGSMMQVKWICFFLLQWICSWMFLLRLLPRTPRFPQRYFYLWVVVETSVLWREYCRKFLFYYPTHSHSLDPRLYVIFLELCSNIVQRDLE